MKSIIKLLQKGLFVFVFLLVAGFGLPKTEVKAAMADWEMYDDDTASYYESTYAVPKAKYGEYILPLERYKAQTIQKCIEDNMKQAE